MKGKIIAVVLMLMATLSIHAASYLTVSDSQGNKTAFALTEKPTVTFSADSLVITAGEETVQYPLTDYRKFELTDEAPTPTSINTLNADSYVPVFSFGDAVSATGLKPGSVVAVYSINGQLVGSAKASENGTVSIPLNGQNGVYVVKSATKSFKFIKK